MNIFQDESAVKKIKLENKVDSNIRSLVFGKSVNNLFSFGSQQTESFVSTPQTLSGSVQTNHKSPETAVPIDPFKEFVSAKILFFQIESIPQNTDFNIPFKRRKALDVITKEFDENKKQLTLDFKKIHKNAKKKKNS